MNRALQELKGVGPLTDDWHTDVREDSGDIVKWKRKEKKKERKKERSSEREVGD